MECPEHGQQRITRRYTVPTFGAEPNRVFVVACGCHLIGMGPGEPYVRFTLNPWGPEPEAWEPAPPATTECEKVKVIIVDQAGDTIFNGDIPAFTRPPDELRAVVADYITHYFDRSAATDNPVSLADFALYLLAGAFKEPRTQPAPCEHDDPSGSCLYCEAGLTREEAQAVRTDPA